ncbi:MAG: 16S rRNA (cytosine(1402)-N(4))-methyltransferase RsmH [Alphaproteobacteria bacterium]
MNHTPVMLAEVLECLRPADRETYLDGTFGAGGYTKAFLDHTDCTVIAVDRDLQAQERSQTLKNQYGKRFTFIHGCFGDVENLLAANDLGQVDGFVLDLGVSSMQIDEALRGFSFRFDGPLDMRMDTGRGMTAADIVNTYDEKDLADLIYQYGEERLSRRIAKKIVERRAEKPFDTTRGLAEVARSCVPRSRKDEIDPATRTFQALRIAVNDELGELDRALEAAVNILRPGGRMIVVSFHSLEDGRVKKFFRDHSSGKPKGSRYLPEEKQAGPVYFESLTKKALQPGAQEMRDNPRSRSARLRAAIRTEAGHA